MTKDNGGAAFPMYNVDSGCKSNEGMTLRDWLAGQALIGFVGAYNCSDEPIKESCAKAAKLAYMLADEMLTERSKEGRG